MDTLTKLDFLLRQELGSEVMDAKILSVVLTLIGNIVCTGRLFCKKTLEGTVIFSLLERVSLEHNLVHPEIFEQVTRVNKSLTKFAFELNLQEKTRKVALTIAQLGL